MITQNTKHREISQLLEELSENPDFKKELTIGKLIDYVGHQSYGIGLLIFALPNILPSASIPGVSLLFGFPIILLSIQLAFFKKKPWFPLWLRSRKIKHSFFYRFLEQAIPRVRKFEKFVKPRYPFFTSRIAQSLIGGVVFLLAILLILPIPFSNILLGSLVAFIALGLIQADGLVLFICFWSSLLTIAFFSEIIELLIVWLWKLL